MLDIDKFTPEADLPDAIGKIGGTIAKSGKEAGERRGDKFSDLIDITIDSIF